jgi:hypothetical protein
MRRLVPATASTTTTLWRTVNSQYSATSTAARVDVVDPAPGNSSEFLHVIGLDGAASLAERSDAPGQTGAAVTLADGRVVTVRFNQNSSGGTISIRSAGGGMLESGALPTSVQAPPVYAN